MPLPCVCCVATRPLTEQQYFVHVKTMPLRCCSQQPYPRPCDAVASVCTAIAFTSSWLLVTTCGYVISVLVTVGALVVLATSWRAVLPRRAWEDPLMVGLNRLPTHSRIHNYPTFEAAAARGQSPNVVSLRCVVFGLFMHECTSCRCSCCTAVPTCSGKIWHGEACF